MTFDSIKQNYDRGLWTAAMVAVAVKKGVITEAQYKAIVGEIEEATVATDTAEPVFILNATGTVYHWPGCSKASDGERLTRDAVAATHPEAKPCGICQPPEISV